MSYSETDHKILISESGIAERLKEIGKQITESYGDEPITILALTNGALVFAADLIRQIKCPVRLDTLGVASYKGRRSTGELSFRSKPKLGISGRNILVVDDILDTGLTLHGVASWLKRQSPESVKICVLLDKKITKREEEVTVDWAGFEIEDLFVYGYGLDRDEFDRNLPFIAYVED
ncbi:hypoxanthine phosphoribosyltransferase [Lentisphaerota bacterium ZTH]|nr:hypoxanthine phosphoribosyltransferase [Lentisphaerota bacterium]WET05952.1 hypoxanthine phosphoribosyltransferase [Lentisphaerota bacterium ZTH]